MIWDAISLINDIIVMLCWFTDCGLLMPYGNIDLGQHLFRKWLLVWWHPTPSHYLNQCWLFISEVVWHSPGRNFTSSAQGAILYNRFVWKSYFRNCGDITKRPMNQLIFVDENFDHTMVISSMLISQSSLIKTWFNMKWNHIPHNNNRTINHFKTVCEHCCI